MTGTLQCSGSVEQFGMSGAGTACSVVRLEKTTHSNSPSEVIRLTVMMYIRYPLSLRQVEDLLFERGIDICNEAVRFFGTHSFQCLP